MKQSPLMAQNPEQTTAKSQFQPKENRQTQSIY
jgi:hypothetical protein